MVSVKQEGKRKDVGYGNKIRNVAYTYTVYWGAGKKKPTCEQVGNIMRYV